MPNKIIWENKGVLSQYHGLLTADINEQTLNTLFGDARIDDAKYIISDFTAVNQNCLTEDDLDYPLAMSTGAASYLKNLKVALIAIDNEIVELYKYYIKIFNQNNTTWECRLFNDIETARTWIGS